MLQDANGELCRNFFTTDGEACILNQAFDEEVLAAFAQAKIDYMKLGPSSTKVQQDWDGPIFRAIKACMFVLFVFIPSNGLVNKQSH